MSIPLLTVTPSSQNQRVAGFEVPGDESPRTFTTTISPSAAEMDSIITASYRQIFHEQQMLSFNRQTLLESQLRSGQISVREFIRGLLTSNVFRSQNYNVNNNYRFVQLCINRVLGREVYSEQEKIAWSIVLATKGLNEFVDALLDCDEYMDTFGEHTVPYQRRRVLPQRFEGERPFERMPRYDATYLAKLEALGHDFSRTDIFTPGWLPRKEVRQVGAALTYAGAVALLGGLVAVALACFGVITL
ncbi:MAG: phycobilisome rod-core linker polypeptide [Leptolyngbyaceae bacterium]|nr:phycobilisome rod-core linker polypeptide [Leptolyngbyaceae bacterium]